MDIKIFARGIKRKIRNIKDISLALLLFKQRACTTLEPRAFVIGTEDFGNLGDHHIAISEIEYLKRYYTEVKEVTASQYYKKRGKLIRTIKKNDLIVMTGGGNFGNIYPIAQDIKRDIVHFWRKNIKVIMPQTIFYSDNLEGKKESLIDSQIFTHNNHILLVCREMKSYQIGKELFDCDIILTPDIVLTSKYLNECIRKNRLLFCIRNDQESILCDDLKNEIYLMVKQYFDDISLYDTQKEYNISTLERENELKKAIREFQESKLVITDRLHGMIFSAVTSTPCIILGNYNHKIRGSYQWLSNLKYVRYANNLNDIKKNLDDRFWLEKYKYNTEMFESQFNLIIHEITKCYKEYYEKE